MNSFQKKIETGIRYKKKYTGRSQFEDIIFVLSKEMNLSISDILSSPTPLILSLSNKLQNYIKQQNKLAKKGR